MTVSPRPSPRPAVRRALVPGVLLVPLLIVTLFASSRAGVPDERLQPPSQPGAAPWLANVQVSDPVAGDDTNQSSPALAAGSTGVLYASWLDYRNSPNQPDLYVSASGDGGAHWNAGVKANGDKAADPGPGHALAVTGGFTLHVAWFVLGDGLYLGRSTDLGANWSTPLRLVAGNVTGLDLLADPFGALYLAWTDASGLLLNRSPDGGDTWSGPKLLVELPAGGSLGWPALASDGAGELHVAWERQEAGKEPAICSQRTTAGQGAWEAPHCFGAGAVSQTSPDIAADRGGPRVAVAWEEAGAILVAVSPDGGGTWTAPAIASGDHALCGEPALVVGGGGATAVAWHDPSKGDEDVYAAHLAAGGAVWSSPERVNDDATTQPQQDAALATIGDHLYAAWADFRLGDWDIYASARPATFVADTTAPTWSGFSPTGWITAKTPDVSIVAQDASAGLDVSTGVYAFSLDGGVTWGGWFPASVTGADGTTAPQTVTAAAVPFGQDSLTTHRNRIRFRVTDMAGNTGESADNNVEIDATKPSNPTGLTGGAPGVWRNDAHESMKWSGASDASSGVAGYSYEWSESATTVPDESIDTSSDALYATIPADGTGWYFHVRAADNAGNWATGATRRGPYWLDTVPPESVEVTYADPPPGNTIDNTLYVEYTGADNPGGSGLAGFAYEWSHDALTAPSPVTNTVATAVTSSPLADGLYYFHIRAVDLAGNSDKITHFGPWRVDTTQPGPPNIASTNPAVDTWSPASSVVVQWEPPTDPSGIAGYSVVWDHTNNTVPDTTSDTTATSATSPALAEGEWWFHVRAVDGSGTWGFTRHTGPFKLDRVTPNFAMTALPPYVGSVTFTVSWTGSDARSGLRSYSLQVRDGSGAWLALSLPNALQTSVDFVGERGHTYTFRGAAIDNAGNTTPGNTEPTTRVGRDITIRVVNESGQPRNGAAVYRSGSRLGATNASGEITAPATLVGDAFSALYLVGTVQNPFHIARNVWRIYNTSVPITGAYGVPQLTTISDLAASPPVLTVRRDQPLFGANLRVTVQWDASAAFLADLRQGLINASSYLYDAGDGQFFLEQVDVEDAGSRWIESDLRMCTDTEEWPNAYHLMGSDSIHGWTAIYTGRLFDGHTGRQGDWSQPNGYRTLIHEFGHYIFDLYDEYEDRSGDKDKGAHCTEDSVPGPPTREEPYRSSLMDSQYTTTEFCSDAEADHHHYYLTEQDYVHDGESCWQTLERMHADEAGRWTLTSPDDRHAILPGPDRLPEPAWMTVNVTNIDRGVCQPFVVHVVNDDGSPRAGADLDLESGGGSMDEGITDSNGNLVILGALPGDTIVLDCGVFCSAEVTVPNPCPAPAAAPGRSADLARSLAAVQVVVQQKPFDMAISVLPLGAGQVRVEVLPTTTLAAPPVVEVQQDGATVKPAMVPISGGRYAGTATLSPDAAPWGHVRAAATSTGGQSATAWVLFKIDSGGPDRRLELMSGDDRFEVNLLAGALTQAAEAGVEAGNMPAPAPAGLVPLSDAYQVRLSSGQAELALACQVRLRYDPGRLAQMDPASLSLYRWDAAAGQWQPVGGTLDRDYSMVYARTTSLGPFALFGTLSDERKLYLPLVRR